MVPAPDEVGRPLADREFEDLYRDEIARVMRMARALTSVDDAHDVVQDAFVGLLRAWDTTENPRAYLNRSIVNGARNTYRRRDSQRARVTALRNDGAGAPAPTADEYLDDLIARLPDTQRAVVVLKFHLQMQDREIADALGIRTGSVGPALTRALRALRKELDHGA